MKIETGLNFEHSRKFALIKKDHCRVTNLCDLDFLDSIKNFPVFMGSVDSLEKEDIYVDLIWRISRGSGLIQLQYLLPLDILYPGTHGAGAVGELWEKHHLAFAKFLSKVTPSSVLEIGGAHGILAKEYQQFGKTQWTILEPNPSPIEGSNAQFIKGFFDDKFTFTDAFDTVVHSHVFEHIYEPDEFMRHLSGFIEPDKHLVFSLPNMQVMLERKYTNCINFEHTVFLTEPYVEYLLAKHGFRVLQKEYFLDDHSIFYATVRDSTVKPVALPDGLYEKNKQLYLEYVTYHKELIKDLNTRMANTKQPIYLFGAHIFAQYLIAFGLDTTRIVSLLDNDPKKQGKRLYGTKLNVQSPKALQDVKDPIVILKAGVYNEEIKADIIENINRNVVFFE